MNKLLSLTASVLVAASSLCASVFHRTPVLCFDGVKQIGKSAPYEVVADGISNNLVGLRWEVVEKGYLIIFADTVLVCSPQQQFFVAELGAWCYPQDIPFKSTLLGYGARKLRVKKILPLYGSANAEFVGLVTPPETVYYVSDLLVLTKEVQI